MPEVGFQLFEGKLNTSGALAHLECRHATQFQPRRTQARNTSCAAARLGF
jgi:hypothetical protein